MACPVRGGAGRKLDDVQANEVAAAAQLHERRLTFTAEPRPWGGLHRVEVDGDALDDGYPLTRRPFEIGIDQVTNAALVAYHGFTR